MTTPSTTFTNSRINQYTKRLAYTWMDPKIKHHQALLDTSLSPDVWESFIPNLLHETNGSGVVCLFIPELEEIPKRAFTTFETLLPKVRNDPSCWIPNDATSAAHVTGYHPPAAAKEEEEEQPQPPETRGPPAPQYSTWNSPRYNRYREGLIWSDGNHNPSIDQHVASITTTTNATSSLSFDNPLHNLEALMHAIAMKVLRAIEQELQLPMGWFQQHYQPSIETSQWHVKHFVHTDNNDFSTNTHHHKNDLVQVLPTHTDPSLISIVIHDRPGIQQGGQGLQVSVPVLSSNTNDTDMTNQQRHSTEWQDIACSGHGVAVVLVGSVLSYVTGRHFATARHRVVMTREEWGCRRAATLFLRPSPTAKLQVPPSPKLSHVSLKRNMTFSEWNSRVAKNYQKSKAKGNHKKEHNNNNHNNKSTNDKAQRNDVTDYVCFRDDYTELSLIPCNMPGREKYLGGERDFESNKIFTIPGHARQVLVIDAPALERAQERLGSLTNDSLEESTLTLSNPFVYPIGPEFEGEFKWLRGVQMSTGIIVGIPCHADSILCVDPKTETVFTVDWDPQDPMAPERGLQWKWHGGQISSHDGCLYCIPQRAETVLKFDPLTNKATFLGGPFPGRNKWYGGLIGPADGAIYGVNQNHCSVLRIDPTSQTATLHGDFEPGGYKWHGGVVGPDNNIYGIPAHGTFC